MPYPLPATKRERTGKPFYDPEHQVGGIDVNRLSFAITDLDLRANALEAGQGGGAVGYTTKALMDADLAHPDGTVAFVLSDTTALNNGMYRKSGASGSGSWVVGTGSVSGWGVLATGSSSSRTLGARAADIVNVKDYGAKGDGVTDDTAAVVLALASGARVFFPAGTYIVGAPTFNILSHTHIRGAGMRLTTIQFKANANTTMFSGATGTYDCSIEDLTLDGNDPSNTSGRAIYWDGGSAAYGPALMLRNVQVTRFAGDPSLLEAVQLKGSLGYHFSNVHFENNRKAHALYMKAPDSVFEGVYFTDNGNSASLAPVVVQQAVANRWLGCYFGGSNGDDQVLLLGTTHNDFIGCINDSAGHHGYRLVDSGGVASIYNRFIGGAATNPGRNANNTYNAFQLEGGASFNTIVGVTIDGLTSNPGPAIQPTWKGQYGVHEDSALTGGSNQVVGSQFGTFGAGPYFWHASTSNVVASPGAGIPVFAAGINVSGPDQGDPTLGYIARFGNGGAIALRAGASGYSYAWLEAIQDDGSNNGKELRLNNVKNGPVSTGTGLLTVGGAMKITGLPSSNPGAGSKQLWYDPADSNHVKFAP